MKPKVSIVSISYNQEKFIKQALDSFLSQKTNFDIEIIIADDASTDGTREIIAEYAKKHGEIFVPVLRKKNIGIQNNIIDALSRARGDYIAICEGDDFWTDDLKLQKQVDFLEKNKDYAVCFHPVRVFFEDKTHDDSIFPEKRENFSLTRLLKSNFIQTNSVMYRRQDDYRQLLNNTFPFDWYMHLFHAQYGKVGYINEVMASYRRHNRGAWWDSIAHENRIYIQHGIKHLVLYVKLKEMFGKNRKHDSIVNDHIADLYAIFNRIEKKTKNVNLFTQAEEEFPGTAKIAYSIISHHLESSQNTVQEQVRIIERLEEEARHKDALLNDMTNRYNDVVSSRLWKMRNKIFSVIKKPKV
ncbi:MAG: glycosyltransferase [Candidatus Microsaccharimonas sp.]